MDRSRSTYSRSFINHAEFFHQKEDLKRSEIRYFIRWTREEEEAMAILHKFLVLVVLFVMISSIKGISFNLPLGIEKCLSQEVQKDHIVKGSVAVEPIAVGVLALYFKV
jgi:hypothetical protein